VQSGCCCSRAGRGGGLDLWARPPHARAVATRLGGSLVQLTLFGASAEAQAERLGGELLPLAPVHRFALVAGRPFRRLTLTHSPAHLAYSLAGLGIALVKHFKERGEGDGRWAEIAAVVVGIEAGQLDQAAWIDLFQAAIVGCAVAIGQNFAAVLLVLLIIPQTTSRTSGCCSDRWPLT